MGNAFSTEELSSQEIGELVAFDSSGHGAAVGRRAVGVAMAMAMVVKVKLWMRAAGGCGVDTIVLVAGGGARDRSVRRGGLKKLKLYLARKVRSVGKSRDTGIWIFNI